MSDLNEICKALLKSAYDFFKAKHDKQMFGGVHWVEFEGGEVIIFTRGEYKEQLMRNITPQMKPYIFESIDQTKDEL